MPGITIVISAYNEGQNIERTVEAILNSNYPREKMEIIVVDDGSTDDTYNRVSPALILRGKLNYLGTHNCLLVETIV